LLFLNLQKIPQMDNELSYSKQEELVNKLKKGNFDAETEISILTESGFEEEKAKEELLKVIKSYKAALFDDIKETKKAKEKENIAWFVVWMCSLLIAMLGDNSASLLLVSVVIAGTAGYLGFPNKPIPTMVCFITGALIMPFACAIYFRNRETYLNLELLIPAALSFGPGLLLKYALSKMMYPAED
jgi:hypothetical protein